MQSTSEPELTLGCRTCDLAVVLLVPAGFDVRPVLAAFFTEHEPCATYVDLARAGRAVSAALLVPQQRQAEDPPR